MFRFSTDHQTSFFDFEDLWDKLVPQGSVFRLFRDLGPILIQPEDFEGLYSQDNGRPSNDALRMTLACLLQQMMNESDRGMEVQTRVNVEIKYALGMALDEIGIDHASLAYHRQRLIVKGLDQIYLSRFVLLMYYLGVLSGDEPFLTDTTHIIAPMSVPTTIELIRQGMRLLVKLISKQYQSEWNALQAYPKAAKYLDMPEETKEYLLDEQAKHQRLEEVVAEADELLSWLETEAGSWKTDASVVKRSLVLCRILHERIIRHPDGKIDTAPPRSVKDILVSAVDIEASFGCKGKTKWHGYKLATVEVGDSGFIAAIDTLKTNAYDADSMEELANQLPLSQVKEPKLIGDTHYGAAEYREKLKSNGIQVVAPLSANVKTFEVEELGFRINADHTELVCPQNKCFTQYNEVQAGRSFSLSSKACKHCPLYTSCFKGKKKRTIYIHESFESLNELHKYNQTKQYKQEMSLRGRIEAKQNELVNNYGMRRSHYIGERKLAYAARLKALAANFCKLNRMLNPKNGPREVFDKNPRDLNFEKAA